MCSQQLKFTLHHTWNIMLTSTGKHSPMYSALPSDVFAVFLTGNCDELDTRGTPESFIGDSPTASCRDVKLMVCVLWRGNQL